jgi:hypothetical protein
MTSVVKYYVGVESVAVIGSYLPASVALLHSFRIWLAAYQQKLPILVVGRWP